MKPASEFTPQQKEFILKAVCSLAQIADNIKPRMTPEEFTECLERLYVRADELLTKRGHTDQQTICE